MRFKQYFLLLSVYSLSAALAHADAWSDLTYAAKAGQTLNLQGQYVRQTANGLSAFTVYRLREGNNIFERRAALDGIARESIRNRNSVHFYTVNPSGLLEARMESIRFFLTVLPLDTQVLKNSYTANEGKEDRIAGRDCRWIWLAPNNSGRYTQGFCLDQQSHLPLIQIYKNNGRITEISSFSRLTLTKPSATDIKPDARLTVTDSLQPPPELNRTHLKNNEIKDDHISNLPAGFFILGRHNMFNAKNNPGWHYMLGDGLVYISLFVEPINPTDKVLPRIGSTGGALSMATTASGTYKVTAVGDMPPSGLMHLVQNIKVK